MHGQERRALGVLDLLATVVGIADIGGRSSSERAPKRGRVPLATPLEARSPP
jgi:hypothetical protein